MATRPWVSLLNTVRLNQVCRRSPQIAFRKIHQSQPHLAFMQGSQRSERVARKPKKVFTTNKVMSDFPDDKMISQTTKRKPQKISGFNFQQWDMVLIENGDLAIQKCEPKDLLKNGPPIIASIRKNSFFSKDRSFSQITIPNRQVSCREWNKIFTEFLETKTATRNLLQIEIMKFLLDKEENDGIRSDDNWNSSDLVQSYIEFLLEDEEAFLVAQPTLAIYFRSCRQLFQTEQTFDLYLKIRGRIKTWNYAFLLEVLHVLVQIDPDRLKKEDIFSFISTAKPSRLWKKIFELHFSLCCRCNDKKRALECMKIYLDKWTNLASNFEQPIFEQSPALSSFFELFGYTEDPVVWKENREVVENFFDYFHRNRSFFSSDEHFSCVEKWFKDIKSERWKTKVFQSSEIRNGNICPVTGQQMLSHRITNDESSVLKQNTVTALLGSIFSQIDAGVLSKHLTDHNDWHTTARPSSIVAFMEFLLQHGPFDVVMDGVNVLYSSGVARNRKFDEGVNTVRQAIKSCRREFESPKILVVARNHLRHILNKDGSDLYDLANFFFLDNDHEDDAFILYAALCSGKDCLVISNDLFRDYKARMVAMCGTQTANLFRKFQASRQVPVFRNVTNASLRIPERPDPIVQRKGDVWHFPLWQKEEDHKYMTGAHRWLCVYKDGASKRKAKKII